MDGVVMKFYEKLAKPTKNFLVDSLDGFPAPLYAT
jgi:hypothetical protein